MLSSGHPSHLSAPWLACAGRQPPGPPSCNPCSLWVMRNTRLSLPQAQGQVGQRENQSQQAVPTSGGGAESPPEGQGSWPSPPPLQSGPPSSPCSLYLSKMEILMLPPPWGRVQEKGEVLGWVAPRPTQLSAQTFSQGVLWAVITLASWGGSWE